MPKLQLDMSRAEIPEKTYRLMIESATYREPREELNEKGNPKFPFIALGLRIVGGDYDNVYVQTIVSLSPNPSAVKNLKKLLESATGREWDGEEELDVDDDDSSVPVLEGATLGGYIVTNTNDGIERTQVRMNSWISEEDLQSAIDAAEGEEPPF